MIATTDKRICQTDEVHNGTSVKSGLENICETAQKESCLANKGIYDGVWRT